MKDPAPRLGRGLASLLGELPSTPATEQIVGEIAVDSLDVNPYQPRGPIALDSLSDLVTSIASQGVLQPLLVRRSPSHPGRYQIVAGERRWRAAKLAGLAAVPCYIRDLDDVDATAAAIVENLQRSDLNPIEEASGFRRLITEFAMTQDHLSAVIGKSRSHVANTLRLLQLPETVQAHLRTGMLSAGHARAALATDDPEAAAELMLAKGLNVRQAEALAVVTRPKPRPVVPPTPPSNPDLQAVQADLSETLGMAVSIAFDGRGGTVKIRYQTLDQLDYIIGRLGSGA